MIKVAAFFEEYDFKIWEKVLILLASLLFLGAMYLFLTDYPLRRYLFNIDDEGHGHSIGTVSLKTGGLRRQFNGEAEFKSIELAEALYDEDTIVTGSEATSILKLDDGSTIEMAPNTMVRLHFQTNLTLGGISRAAVIDVVAGNVKPDRDTKVVIRKAAKPIEVPRVVLAPKPKPTVDLTLIKGVELIMPRQGTQLMLDKGTLLPEKPVTFTWRVSPPDRRVQLTLWKLASRAPNARRIQLYQEVLSDQAGQGVAQTTLKMPGLYQWELRGPKGEPIPGARKTTANFTMNPDFEAIEPLEPLVGGEVVSSNKLTGRQFKNFDITLRWKPYPGADRYRIAVKTQPNSTQLVLDKFVQESQYLFNKDRVYNGQIYYEVTAPLRNGFIAHSRIKPFVFTFLAPSPVTPVNHAQISKEILESEADSVLITWQKTNFTEWYELEISKDLEFKTTVHREKLKENFYIFKSPPPARYFWRIRSSTKKVISPFSPAFDIDVLKD